MIHKEKRWLCTHPWFSDLCLSTWLWSRCWVWCDFSHLFIVLNPQALNYSYLLKECWNIFLFVTSRPKVRATFWSCFDLTTIRPKNKIKRTSLMPKPNMNTPLSDLGYILNKQEMARKIPREGLQVGFWGWINFPMAGFMRGIVMTPSSIKRSRATSDPVLMYLSYRWIRFWSEVIMVRWLI